MVKHSQMQLHIRKGAYLPHWTREGGEYFVTFRLADSLPQSVLEELIAERQLALKKERIIKQYAASMNEKRVQLFLSQKVEAYLDSGSGASWMRRDDVAAVVEKALLYFDRKRYRLVAWCIMPNHVHVVIRPEPGTKLADILHSWKSLTAKRINKLLKRKGKFWQPEYYDHLIRDESDLNRCVEYTYYNPERAGMREWKWRGFASNTDVN
jgi:REP element-mobilizing transposase RayT